MDPKLEHLRARQVAGLSVHDVYGHDPDVMFSQHWLRRQVAFSRPASVNEEDQAFLDRDGSGN
eukprot:11043683-Lingulodinium_polyedra.AAC.1